MWHVREIPSQFPGEFAAPKVALQLSMTVVYFLCYKHKMWPNANKFSSAKEEQPQEAQNIYIVFDWYHLNQVDPEH